MRNLKNIRIERKLKQKELASIIGVQPNTYCNWEKGNTEIDFANLIKLADYFNVTTDFLLDRTEEGFFVNSKIKTEIQTIFDQLNDMQQAQVLGFAKAFLSDNSISNKSKNIL